MRLLFILAILLAFPVLEIWLLITLGNRYGWWLLLYLLIVAFLGWRLILEEKLFMLGRMAQTLAQGGTPMKALFGSFKNLLAGILLIIPGVLSDVIALILLLLPTAKAEPKRQNSASSNSIDIDKDVIEGEFHREE
ncbi:MAG: FxsA family protein [Methylophilaceae bacterium]|nr:FxsA family protein [Methylophilaceae bacterium]